MTEMERNFNIPLSFNNIKAMNKFCEDETNKKIMEIYLEISELREL